MGALSFLPFAAIPWNVRRAAEDADRLHTARGHCKYTENYNATRTKTGGRQFLSLPSEHIGPPKGDEQAIRPEANIGEREIRGQKR